MSTGFTRLSGQSMSMSSNMPIRRSLVNSIMSEEQNKPVPRRAPRVFNGPKTANGKPRASHPDHVILEVRRLHEQCFLPPTRIVEDLASHGIEASASWVRSCTQYCQRSHLVPAANSQTYLESKK